MKSPPLQIHDDIAHKRVEAFIRGEDNETLVGNEVSAQGRQGAGRPRRRRKAAAAAVSQGRQLGGAPPAPRDHRSPRIVERAAIVGYKADGAPSSRTCRRACRAAVDRHRGRRRSYLAWPAKRRVLERQLRPRAGAPAGRPARPAARPRARTASTRATSSS